MKMTHSPAMTGADLIALAAERVMGWSVVRVKTWRSIYFTNGPFPELMVCRNGRTVLWREVGQEHSDETWNPLESDADAMMLVDAVQGKHEGGWRFSLLGDGRTGGIYFGVSPRHARRWLLTFRFVAANWTRPRVIIARASGQRKHEVLMGKRAFEDLLARLRKRRSRCA